MFADSIQRSNVLELISEETQDGGGMHKVLVRVLDKKRWSTLVVRLLKIPHEMDDASFGVSIRKEYYLDADGNPTFCWVLLFWGDLEEAVSACDEALAKRFGPPPVPVPSTPSAVFDAPAAGNKVHRLQRRISVSEDGSQREIITIPLPGTTDRNAPGRTRKKAFVENGIVTSIGDKGQMLKETL